MHLIEGRWTKSYINSFRDKRALDNELRGRYSSRSEFARMQCEEANYPELTASEISGIDAYWARWGVKICDCSWHRMYYAVTGVHDPRFMPDDFVGLCLYSYYNDEAYVDAWRDKNMFERLVPSLRFPSTIGQRVRGRFVGPKGEVLSTEAFAELLFDEAAGEPVIVKDARLSGHGRGVTKQVISSIDDALSLIEGRSFSENYLVQRCIRQHPALAAYNESSVNVLRLLTWRHESTVDLLFAALRYGLPGEVTDDCERDGKEVINVVAVGENGSISEVARNLEGEIVGTFGGDQSPRGTESSELRRRRICLWITSTLLAGPSLSTKTASRYAWNTTSNGRGRWRISLCADLMLARKQMICSRFSKTGPSARIIYPITCN